MTTSDRSTALRRRLSRVAALAGIATLTLGVGHAWTAPASPPSSVITVDPARVLDTREPIGVPGAAPVGPDSTITVQIAGVGGVPLDATGVILTLTAADATADTYVTATPTGSPRSTTSVLNPGVSKAIANTITIGLGEDGKIDLYNKFGHVHLIADVSGYLVPGSTIVPAIETGAIELTAYSAMVVSPVGPLLEAGCIDLGNTGEMVLDIPLEHGAAITSIDFHFFDSDPANMTFVLHEIDSVNGGRTTSGTLSDSQVYSHGASGYGYTTATPTGADKTSSSVRYVAYAFTLGQGNQLGVHAFCGATVNYARETGA
jgi:hypothetical protein